MTELKEKYKELEIELIALAELKKNLQIAMDQAKIEMSRVDDKILKVSKIIEIIDKITKH